MAQFNLGLGGDLERQFPLPNGNPDTVIEQTMAPALGARTAALGDPAAAAVSAPEPPAGPALPAPAAPRPPDPVARPGGAVDPPSLGGGGRGPFPPVTVPVRGRVRLFLRPERLCVTGICMVFSDGERFKIWLVVRQG